MNADNVIVIARRAVGPRRHDELLKGSALDAWRVALDYLRFEDCMVVADQLSAAERETLTPHKFAALVRAELGDDGQDDDDEPNDPRAAQRASAHDGRHPNRVLSNAESLARVRDIRNRYLTDPGGKTA